MEVLTHFQRFRASWRPHFGPRLGGVCRFSLSLSSCCNYRLALWETIYIYSCFMYCLTLLRTAFPRLNWSAWVLFWQRKRTRPLTTCHMEATADSHSRLAAGSGCRVVSLVGYRSRAQARSRGGAVQELCETERRGGRLRLSVLTSLTVSVDVKQHRTVLRHWSQFVPDMSTDIRGHEPLHHCHHLALWTRKLLWGLKKQKHYALYQKKIINSNFAFALLLL